MNRKKCYDLVHEVIIYLDNASKQPQDMVDGQITLASKRRDEAYGVIANSDDEVFQTDLYDWYLSQGRADRLLELHSPYVATYLERKSSEDIAHADLLWKHHSQCGRNHDAATVQLALAKSAFPLSLDRRIEYLSQAKLKASTYTSGVGRQTRQILLREISDMLDIATIQGDILQRLKGDPRVTAEVRPTVLGKLDGPILSLNQVRLLLGRDVIIANHLPKLFNDYADQASYHDLCIVIYEAADHRNPIDIRKTWDQLVNSKHEEALAHGTEPRPYEVVGDTVRNLGKRLVLSEVTFPIPDLVPLLAGYAFELQPQVAPAHWAMDIFLELQVPCDALFNVLEWMVYHDEAPFHGPNRRIIASDMLYVAQKWYVQTARSSPVLGGVANAEAVVAALGTLMGNRLLVGEELEACRELRARIEMLMR